MQQPYKVSYVHMRQYRVSRRFDSREAAQEFIDINAAVCPLPGVRLEGPMFEALTQGEIIELTDKLGRALAKLSASTNMARDRAAGGTWIELSHLRGEVTDAGIALWHGAGRPVLPVTA